MVTACIVGVANYGRKHYSILTDAAARGEVRIVAATVRHRERDREQCERLRSLGCALYDDHAEMLRRHGAETDLCVIPTGIHLHAPMTVDALRAGANVLVEKPAAPTVQDVRAMQEAEAASGRFVAVGYQSMYAAETLVMKRAILDGRLGELRAVKCRGLWPRAESYYERNAWAGRLSVGDPRSGGHGSTARLSSPKSELAEVWVLDSPFNNAIAHQLNMICFLAGTELARSASLRSVQAELYRGYDIESADTAAVRAVTSAGVRLSFYVSHCPERNLDPQIVVRGDEGTMTWDFHRTLVIETGGRAETTALEWIDGASERMYRTVMERLARPETFVCTLEVAGAQTAVVNGAHQSSPVRSVPAGHLRRVPEGESARVVIEGLDDVVARAFEEERLFSELDPAPPWAHEAPVFPLEGYEEFTGPAEPC